MFFNDSEERIEKMLAGGRKIMDEAIAEHKPVAILAGFSGGNDSVVVTHFACTEYGAAAVNVNTMIGVEKSREHARNTAAKFGWHFIEKQSTPSGPPRFQGKTKIPWNPSVLQNGKWEDGATKYEEFCFNFGMPGPGMHPRMYQILKERVFNRFRKDAKVGHHKYARVMFVSGVRHDESSIRAGYKRAVSKLGSSVWVNPFYWNTKADFALYREEFGLPRNPVTDIVGISGECLCGTMGSPEELDAVAKVEPATTAYVKGIEAKCESLGLPCKWATRPEPRVAKKCSDLQMLLFGDEPTFQPACVGCMRRRPNLKGDD